MTNDGPLVKPGTSTERYVVSTVPTAPSSIYTDPVDGSVSPEGQSVLGFPQAAPTNPSNEVSVSVRGLVPAEEKNLVEGDEILTLEVKETGSMIPTASGYASVARFGVTRGDGVSYSLDTHWSAESPLTLSGDIFPSDENDGYHVGRHGTSAPVAGPDGSLYVFVTARIGSGTDYRILCFRYNQEDGAAVNFEAYAYSPKLVADIGLDEIIQPSTAACVVNDRIYIAVSHYGYLAAPEENSIPGPDRSPLVNYGDVHLFSMPIEFSNPVSIVLATDRILKNTGQVTQRFDGGVALAYSSNRMVLAVGVREQALGSHVNRHLLVASSVDFVNWSLTENNINALGILGSTSEVFSPKSGGGILALDILQDETNNVMCATTKGGSIWLSYDNGQSWIVSSSFASRNNIDLSCVKIVPGDASGQYVIYVGGSTAEKLGVMLRTIDKGQSWQVIHSPVNFTVNKDDKSFDVVTGSPSITDTANHDVYSYQVSDADLERKDGHFLTPFVSDALPSDPLLGFVSMPIDEGTAGGGNTEVVLWAYTKKAVAIIRNAQSTDPISKDTKGGGRFFRVLTVGEKGAKDSEIRTVQLLKRDSVSPELLVGGNFVKEEYTSHKDANSYTNAYPLLVKPGYKDASSGQSILHWKNALTVGPTQSQKSFNNGYLFSTDNLLVNGCKRIAIVNETFAYFIDNSGHLCQWQAAKPQASPDYPLIPTTYTLYNSDVVTLPLPAFRDVTSPMTGDFSISSSDSTISGTTGKEPLYAIQIGRDPAAPDADTILVVCGPNGRLHVSYDHGETFSTYLIPIPKTLENLTLDVNILMPNQAEILVSLPSGIYNIDPNDRLYPTLQTLASGDIFLTDANSTKGVVEGWVLYKDDVQSASLVPQFTQVLPWAKSVAQSGSPQSPNKSISDALNTNTPIIQERISFAVPSDTSKSPINIPKPTVFQTVEGTVYILADRKAIANRGDWKEWLPTTSNQLILPLHPIHNDEPGPTGRTETLTSCAYGNGRIFAFWYDGSTTFKVYTNRNWQPATEAHVKYPPVIQKYQWIGIGDAQVKWASNPSPGSKYLIPLYYQYGRHQLTIDSPSFDLRIFSDAPSSTAVHLVWDRESDAIVDILGDGTHWPVNACALFGTDFPWAKWAITVPDYKGSTFPTDRSLYTEFNLTAVAEQGVINGASFVYAADGPTYGNVRQYITDPSKKWIPNCYASGVRTWYLMVATTMLGLGDVPTVQIRKIIGNTPTTLLYEGDRIVIDYGVDSLQGDHEYCIYGDRMFNDGSQGTRTDDYGNPEPTLDGSAYEFGRMVRLTVPQLYGTAEGYHSIGRILFGRQSPIVLDLAAGTLRKHRFSRGFRWSIVPFVQEEITPSGIQNVRVIGKPKLTFQLRYDQIEDWEINVFMNLLMPNINQPFAMLFDGQNDQTLEYVRLVGNIDVEHIGGPLFGNGVNVETVQ